MQSLTRENFRSIKLLTDLYEQNSSILFKTIKFDEGCIVSINPYCFSLY